MSLGLATSKVAEYSGRLEFLASQMSTLEGLAQQSVKDPAAAKDIARQIQIVKTLYGMVKDFLEFWKEVIKSVLGMLKMFTELAQGSR